MARIYQVLEADLQFLPSRSENLEKNRFFPNLPKNAITKPEVGSIEVESWKNQKVYIYIYTYGNVDDVFY